MMEFIRNFAKSRFGIVALALVLSPMAFLGINAGMGGGANSADNIIEVNNASIPVREFQTYMSEQRKNLTSNGIDASLINEDVLQDNVIDNLVHKLLLEQQSQKLGFTASDATITEILKNSDVFKDENGKFSNEYFAHYLRETGMIKDQLFAQKRTEIASTQLTNGILTTAIYPFAAINKMIELQTATKQVWIHRLEWKNFLNAVNVTDADIKSYYDKNKATLKTQDMVNLAYIKITSNDMKIGTITQDELDQQYTLYKQENNLTDMRQLSQILLTADKTADKKAQEIQAKLASGAKFADLAKQYSQDPTGKTGGEIGQFNRDMFKDDAKKVEKSLQGLTVGQTSQPVKTSFGVQIFHVTADDSGNIPTLASLKDELTKKAQEYKQQAVFTEKVALINTLAVDGVGLQEIAKQEGFTVESIADYAKENNSSALSQPAVIEKAFDEFLIQDQSVSAAIELEEARVWVQATDYRPAKTMSVEMATPIIKAKLTKEKATQLALTEANNLAKNIKTKADITANPSVIYTFFGTISRQHPLLDNSEAQVAFASSAKDTLNVKVAKTNAGASVIVSDAPTEDTEKPEMNAVQKQQIAQSIRNSIGESHLSDYLQYLKTQNSVTISKDKINSSEGQ